MSPPPVGTAVSTHGLHRDAGNYSQIYSATRGLRRPSGFPKWDMRLPGKLVASRHTTSRGDRWQQASEDAVRQGISICNYSVASFDTLYDEQNALYSSRPTDVRNFRCTYSFATSDDYRLGGIIHLVDIESLCEGRGVHVLQKMARPKVARLRSQRDSSGTMDDASPDRGPVLQHCMLPTNEEGDGQGAAHDLVILDVLGRLEQHRATIALELRQRLAAWNTGDPQNWSVRGQIVVDFIEMANLLMTADAYICRGQHIMEIPARQPSSASSAAPSISPRIRTARTSESPETPRAEQILMPIMRAEAFNITHPAFCLRTGVNVDLNLLQWNGNPISLYALHCEVLCHGGETLISQFGVWPDIGARLGFVQIPKDAWNRPAMSSPDVAQHLRNIYDSQWVLLGMKDSRVPRTLHNWPLEHLRRGLRRRRQLMLRMDNPAMASYVAERPSPLDPAISGGAATKKWNIGGEEYLRAYDATFTSHRPFMFPLYWYHGLYQLSCSGEMTVPRWCHRHSSRSESSLESNSAPNP
ncbi:uncharacterized protein C8Q71DRAFT_851597, partial [Rhodofomes roseus]